MKVPNLNASEYMHHHIEKDNSGSFRVSDETHSPGGNVVSISF